MTRLISALALLSMLFACSCGSRDPAGLPETALPPQPSQPAAFGAPAFPQDSLLPGESLDASGHVLPERNSVASALGIDDEFQAGRDYFDSAGVSGKNGVAATLAASAGATAWTIHRIPLAGQQPGLLSVDANLLPDALGGESSYYIAVANYSTQRWDWRGPFTDNHVRISLDPSAGHLSSLGNAYCAVLCHNGSSVDLVGVSLAPRDGADSTPPGQVTGVGGPILGRGIDLQWDTVPAADLAGYAIYYSQNAFSGPDSVGVRNIGYLEGTTRHLLSVEPGFYVMRIAAVDISGNRGPLSSAITADVQNNGSLQLTLATDSTLASIGKQLSISASGAELYDVDMDGDGIYETIGSTDSVHSTLLSGAGIIRPRVRGYDAGAAHVALGGLSVLVTVANLPPFADIDTQTRSVAQGQLVLFNAGSSTDLDGGIEQYEWDFDGDGTFDLDSGASSSASWSYATAGRFPAAIRVTDDDGDQSTAALWITVRGMVSFPITESGGTPNIELEMVNGNPAIAYVNGVGNNPWFMQAQDGAGSSWHDPVKIHDSDVVYEISMAVVNGNPAVVFHDSLAARAVYARATDPDGTAWAAPIQFNPAGDTGGENDLTVINGNPAVLHRGANTMLYTRASNASGTAWNGTVTVDNTAGTGLNPVLLDTIDRPSAVFGRSSDAPPSWRSCDGNDADGTSWGSVNLGGDTDGNNSFRLDAIQIPTGSLAASFVLAGSGFELRTRYRRNVPIDQWVDSRVLARAEAYGNVKLGMAGGLPFAVYSEDTNHARLIFVPALDAYGNSWGSPVLLVSYDAAAQLVFDVGEASGHPVLAWQNNSESFISFGTIYD